MTDRIPLSPRARYDADLAKPGFVADAAQARAVDALQKVYDDLLANPPKKRFARCRAPTPGQAWAMQKRVAGITSRRASAIASPHTSQRP